MTSTPPSAASPAAIRYPRAIALQPAREICRALQPVCERLIVAGSLRRGKPEVKDVEILYIPRRAIRTDPDDFFSLKDVSLADEALDNLITRGILRQRRNARGSVVYGPRNKLALHRFTGVPVDLFSTTEESWFNYLVCRTGPAELNVLIARRAQERGWTWKPYSKGFLRTDPLTQMEEWFTVTSEADVFTFVRLPFLPPSQRASLV